MPKSLTVHYNKLWKILQEMGILENYFKRCEFLLGNLYTGQEATVRTGPGTTDWCTFSSVVDQSVAGQLGLIRVFLAHSSCRVHFQSLVFSSP